MENRSRQLLNPYETSPRLQLADNFAVLSSWEFLKDLLAEERMGIEERLLVKSMLFGLSHATGIVEGMFERSARQNSDAALELQLDYITHRTADPATRNVLAHMGNNGVDITYTNPFNPISRMVPLIGRDHRKMAIIDDVAYVGKVNLVDASFKEAIDVMVKLTDPRMVGELVELFQDGHRVSEHDTEISFPDDTSILIDSGKPGTSIIMDRGIDMVRQARQKVIMSGCFVPDGRLLKALSDKYAEGEGIDIEVVTSQAAYMEGWEQPVNAYNKYSMGLLGRNIPIEYIPGYVHATYIVVDDSVCLVGSHNLSEKGVWAGTEELNLYSTNHVLIEGLNYFYKSTTNLLQDIRK
jgi:phosphatidylserine/phosphatidylglycerophosphate/cardiolipin synthase-like enzyme